MKALTVPQEVNDFRPRPDAFSMLVTPRSDMNVRARRHHMNAETLQNVRARRHHMNAETLQTRFPLSSRFFFRQLPTAHWKMARRPQTTVSGRRLRNHHSNYVNGGGVDVFGMILLGADRHLTTTPQVHPDVCHPI